MKTSLKTQVGALWFSGEASLLLILCIILLSLKMGIMTHAKGDNVGKWASGKMTIHLTQIKVQTTAVQRGTS